MTIEQKAKAYDEAIKIAKSKIKKDKDHVLYGDDIIDIFPELKESEDERIRKELIEYLKRRARSGFNQEVRICNDAIAWLEKRGEQKPQGKSALEVWKDMRLEVYQQASGNRHEPNYSDDNTKMFSLTDIDEIFEKVAEKQGEQNIKMIQWKGDNLREVIEFTGKSPKFNEWFKTWDDYENYVRSHGNIFKMFCADGSHYEVPLGAWIVKTPDGYNVASKATHKHKVEQKHAPKFKVGDCIYDKRDSYNRYFIREVGNDYYINALGQKMDMAYTNANFEFLKHLEDNHTDSKPAAWSEEDEYVFNKVLNWMLIVNPTSSIFEKLPKEQFIERFKFLKERMKGE